MQIEKLWKEVLKRDKGAVFIDIASKINYCILTITTKEDKKGIIRKRVYLLLTPAGSLLEITLGKNKNILSIKTI